MTTPNNQDDELDKAIKKIFNVNHKGTLYYNNDMSDILDFQDVYDAKAAILAWHNKQLEQAVIEARIDELTELSRRFWQLSVPERAILGRIRVLINEQEEAQSKS